MVVPLAGEKTGTYVAGTVTSNLVLNFGAATSNFITIGHITLPTSISWTGATSTDWNVASNWSSTVVPSSSKNVVIPTDPLSGRYPIINSGLAITKNLSIVGPNGKLTLLRFTAYDRRNP